MLLSAGGSGGSFVASSEGIRCPFEACALTLISDHDESSKKLRFVGERSSSSSCVKPPGTLRESLRAVEGRFSSASVSIVSNASHVKILLPSKSSVEVETTVDVVSGEERA